MPYNGHQNCLDKYLLVPRLLHSYFSVMWFITSKSKGRTLEFVVDVKIVFMKWGFSSSREHQQITFVILSGFWLLRSGGCIYLTNFYKKYLQNLNYNVKRECIFHLIYFSCKHLNSSNFHRFSTYSSVVTFIIIES